MKTRVEAAALLGGFDWSKAWAVIQKVSPQLQQILMAILEEFARQPALAQAVMPNYQATAITYGDCEECCRGNAKNLAGLDPASLLALLQIVGPILGKIILGILAKFNTTPAGPTPTPAGPTPVNPSV